MRPAAPGDFQVTVDDIGNFTFGRRTPRDVFRIRGLYAQLTGGNYAEDGSFADLPAFAYATLQVMAVQTPEGFTPENIDALADENWEAKLIRVFGKLREKELSFRPGSGEAGQAASA